MDTNKNEIVLLKLFNGEMVLGTRVHPLGETIESMFDYALENPRALMIAPTMDGSVRVLIAKVCEPFKVKRLAEKISIPKSQVMFCLEESEIDKELLNGYKSEISGVKIATAAETASINSNANGGNIII